jgi:hypothetical protein
VPKKNVEISQEVLHCREMRGGQKQRRGTLTNEEVRGWRIDRSSQKKKKRDQTPTTHTQSAPTDKYDTYSEIFQSESCGRTIEYVKFSFFVLCCVFFVFSEHLDDMMGKKKKKRPFTKIVQISHKVNPNPSPRRTSYATTIPMMSARRFFTGLGSHKRVL